MWLSAGQNKRPYRGEKKYSYYMYFQFELFHLCGSVFRISYFHYYQSELNLYFTVPKWIKISHFKGVFRHRKMEITQTPSPGWSRDSPLKVKWPSSEGTAGLHPLMQRPFHNVENNLFLLTDQMKARKFRFTSHKNMKLYSPQNVSVYFWGWILMYQSRKK